MRMQQEIWLAVFSNKQKFQVFSYLFSKKSLSKNFVTPPSFTSTSLFSLPPSPLSPTSLPIDATTPQNFRVTKVYSYGIDLEWDPPAQGGNEVVTYLLSNEAQA